jgi:hypothetical protein
MFTYFRPVYLRLQVFSPIGNSPRPFPEVS